jgi:hypothetical protein
MERPFLRLDFSSLPMLYAENPLLAEHVLSYEEDVGGAFG